jgi:hypothetical protein
MKGELIMKKLTLILFVVPAFFIISCASTLKVNDIDSWLTTKAGGQAAAVYITGTWKDAMNDNNLFMSWGQGKFIQQGNSITGNISYYAIKGIVAGKTVYLVLTTAGAIDYTAKLELRNNNELYGNYYSSRDTNQTAPTPMVFKKIK